MLRISNLLRGKIMPRKIPMRAGLPNWDRPDPPASVTVQLDHQLTDEQIQFTFFDRSMPQFFLTQPEVYQGDTLAEATPMLLKGLGLVFGTALFIGATAWFGNPLKSIQKPDQFFLQKSERQTQMVASKKWFEWGNKNPLGIKLTTENYPPTKLLDPPNTPMASYRQVNQNQAYYQKERAAKKVQQRLSAPKHQQHHSQGHNQGHAEQHTQAHQSQEQVQTQKHH